MGLSEAMLEIAEQIEKDSQQAHEEDIVIRPGDMLAIARQIRSAVKAAEGTQLQQMRQALLPPEVQHRNFIEEARQEFRKDKGSEGGKGDNAHPLIKEDEGTLLMALCINGPADANIVGVSPDMPIGAKTLVLDGVYHLGLDRKLHYDGPAPLMAVLDK